MYIKTGKARAHSHAIHRVLFSNKKKKLPCLCLPCGISHLSAMKRFAIPALTRCWRLLPPLPELERGSRRPVVVCGSVLCVTRLSRRCCLHYSPPHTVLARSASRSLVGRSRGGQGGVRASSAAACQPLGPSVDFSHQQISPPTDICPPFISLHLSLMAPFPRWPPPCRFHLTLQFSLTLS